MSSGAAPGVRKGVFATLGDPLFNDGERVAFLGQLKLKQGGVTQTNATGLWAINGGGKLQLFLRLHLTAAPGYPFGVYFHAIRQFSTLSTGGLLIHADVTGAVAPGDNEGIWVANPWGSLQLIVRKGGGLMVDGVAKKITALQILSQSTDTQAQTRSFNASNLLVYRAFFSDGTQGVFQVQLP